MGGGDENQVKETEAQKALASVAKARLADYQNRWAPVENFFIDKVSHPEAIRDREVGRAAAETRAQFGSARGRVVDKLASVGGAAPGSGKFDTAMTSLGIDEARSGGINRSAADQAVEDQYVKGLQDVTRMGQGQSADAFKGFGATAEMSGRAAFNDARVAEQESEGLGRSIGTGIGLYGASGGFGKAGAAGGIPTANGVGLQMNPGSGGYGLNPSMTSSGAGLRY